MLLERLKKDWEFFLFFFIILVIVCISTSGHDVQRVGQVVIGALCCFYFFRCSGVCSIFYDVACYKFFCCIAIFGFFSVVFSRQFEWALVEVFVFIVFLCIALMLCDVRRVEGEWCDVFLVFFVCFICSIKISQFSAAVVSSFFSVSKTINTDFLIEGFSNKRFYGQFQTFTLPLLALPLLLVTTKRSTLVWGFSLLSLWWLIAITGGTRGTWLGMGGSIVVLFMAGHTGKRWIAWQFPAIVVGITLYWLLFSVLTGYLGIEVNNFASDRLTTSLSNRGPLWQQAWDMIRERPWLGFGPMHFADIHNPIAAHPHQAILQWASEWGVPSTLLVMWLVGRGLWATFRLIRERATSNDPVDLLRVCLFASLIGALTQSMVDGVIVMPYSQLWLSLVVGWLMGIHVWKGEPAKPNALVHWSWMGVSTAAVLFLVYIVIRDVPRLDERNKLYQEQYGGHFQPRFWTQGVIASKPQ
ncbi:O-antigen ligase family protein [Pseudomonas gingeri]|uniref:O-antigen ligase family protein n=1 Tax=Pseudomonas gingeri TaxID=117681 RepID=A0A7Y8CJI3_9PSED|nr:O-antigen ligase family protein [Pseudomonas gingeri]NWB25352.1 O-antigen ligase family protein [Pseudomonas gingeri]NWC33393.1 O-antigen ligase family protein [Pseudomonas gingeri]